MRMTRLLCVLSAGALLLSACGGDDSADDTDAGLGGDPIKIGQIAPTGTSIYNSPDSVAVANAAVRGVNQRGGIDGRPLEMVYCNDHVDPNKAADCARKMVSEGVVAVVRSIVVAGGDQVSAILAEAGIPDVGRGALVPAEFASPNAYLLDGGVLTAYAGVLQHYADEGGESVFFAVAESASGATTLQNLERMAGKVGLEVAGTATLPQTNADFAPFVANIEQSGAQAVLPAFSQQMIQQTIRTADQSGLEIDWLLNGGGVTQEDLGSFSETQTSHMIVGTGTLPLGAADDNEAVAQMKDDIEAQLDAGDDDADPDKLFPNAFIAWAAVNTLATVMSDLDTIDTASITAALDKAKAVDVGISAPWTPSQPGPKDFARVSHPFVHINEVKDGHLVPIDGGEPIDVGRLLG